MAFSRRVLLFGVALVIATSAVGQDKPALPNLRVRAAAEFAERFLERYNETLDLAPIWDEFFAVNAIELNRKIDSDFALCMYAPRLDTQLMHDVNDVSLKRRIVAEANVLYVSAIYMLANADLTDENRRDRPEFPEAYKTAKAGMKYFGHPEMDFRKVPKLSSRTDLEQYINEATALTAILRSNMPSGWQNSARFKKNWEYVQRQFREGVVEHAEESGIAEYYYIPRAVFWISVLHDGHAYRIFHLSDVTD